MKRVCDICGREFDSRLAFCDACGTPVPECGGMQSSQEIPVIQEMPATKNAADEQVQDGALKTDDVVGLGTYFGLTVLFAIPVIGLIASFIVIFVSKNKNIKNYAKATTIWLAISLVIGIFLVFATVKVVRVIEKKMNQYEIQLEEKSDMLEQLEGLGEFLGGLDGVGDSLEQFGDLGESLEQFGDLGESLEQYGDLGGLLEQFEGSGDLGELGDMLDGFGDIGDSLDSFGDFSDSLEQYGDLDGLLDDLENSDLGDLFNSFGY